ncbi:MAG: GNAT family N-acetyltransferase [Alphaproteobacteria bacterium]|nr:GNAT family N-acetyltransferase [Alphaproteobacteria bacterium]
MTAEPVLTVSDTRDAAAEAVFVDGLGQFNDALTGQPTDSRPLSVLVHEPTSHQVLGGVLARSSRGLLFVDLVYLPEALRGTGLSARMLAMAEDEAKARGCTAAVLHTLNPKAAAFYTRVGYREFGRVQVAAPGSTRIYLSKVLA